MHVFLLWHSYERDGINADKLCGVFSSRAEAETAQQRLAQQPGFRERPDNFMIDDYVIDQVTWAEGFGPQ